MSFDSKWAAACIAISTLILHGCNSNQPKPDEPQAQNAPASATSTPTARTTDARMAQPAQPAAKPAVAVPNPSTITFQKMAVALDPNMKQSIAQIAERARTSRKVTLIGFCDRSQIANPTDAAVARAVAVRDELAALGVAPANMLVKLDIKTPKKHAVEVHFD